MTARASAVSRRAANLGSFVSDPAAGLIVRPTAPLLVVVCQPMGMTPRAMATPSMTSEQTTARQMTFLWKSARSTLAKEISSSIAGTSGLVRWTGCPTIEPAPFPPV